MYQTRVLNMRCCAFRQIQHWADFGKTWGQWPIIIL